MRKEDIESLNDLLYALPFSKSITIISHVNPDGDAIGSSLGLYHFLCQDGHENVSVVSPNSYPDFLSWMPGAEKIILASDQYELAIKAIDDADIIFCLDFNDPKRTDNLSEALIRSKGKKILIDHHLDPFNEFDLIFSQTNVSSTAELVYEVISALGKINLLDYDVAQCLYAGIVTDTGSFSYACNSPRTYHIVAELISLGINGENIQRNIYDTYSEDRMRLLGFCLSERLRVFQDFYTAYIFLSHEDLQRFHFREGDTEGVVNYALSIKGIKVAAMFIQRDAQIKVSFRSEGDVNVNVLARRYFNGGGHKNASGGYCEASMEQTLAYFESLLVDISAHDFRLLKDDVKDND